MPRAPRASAISTTDPTTHTSRGRFCTRSPIRRHGPWVTSVPLSPTCGTKGQNARRPKIVSRAGSRVIMKSIASATPIAPTGPRPLVPFTWASTSVNSAQTTVRAEATIAGPAVRSASSIASCLSSWRRSSSRYLDTSSSA